MAKRAKKTGGPYLAAAFFCETVLEDKDGALTPIRIIDQINILIPQNAPADFPSEENRISVPAMAVLSFRTGDSPGNHTIRVVMESPTGKRNPPFEQTLPFSEVKHGGANIRLNMTVAVVNGGLFWADVFLDGNLVTRMPLQITVQREQQPESQTAPSGSINVQPPA
jgi:Family of unknown function (DUF6941)